MLARYTVSAEPARDLLRIELSGFFDSAALARFDAARRAAHKELRCLPNQHVVLVDVRQLQLQTQAAIGAARAIIAAPSTRARRLAFVTGSAAIRMQVRRLSERPDIRCFERLSMAEAWLAEPAAPIALAG